MSILFYDHLINRQPVYLKIDSLPIAPDKKQSLKEKVDDILHTGLLEYILQKLHPHQHRTFLSRFESTPYDPELIAYLKQHIDEKIEDEIRQQADRLLLMIKKDLRG